MKLRIFILSFILLASFGCPATIPIISTVASVGVVSNKITNVLLTRESLRLKGKEIAIKDREIELKEKQFKALVPLGGKTSELNKRLDTVEDFMRYFPKPFKDLGDANENKI